MHFTNQHQYQTTKGGQYMTRVLLVCMLCLVVVAGVFAQTPPVPTNLAAVQINDFGVQVKLTWDSSDSLVTYRVYRSTNDTNHYQNIGGTTPGVGRIFYDGYCRHDVFLLRPCGSRQHDKWPQQRR